MGELTLPRGFYYSGVYSGVKRRTNSLDLSLIVSEVPAVAAGVYTQNLVVAAPVIVDREKTPTSAARAVVINSGNANACTGQKGLEDAREMCSLTARAISPSGGGTPIADKQVLVMSTGVIGRPLPMEKIRQGIQQAAAELSSEDAAFLRASDGILTTDKSRKIATSEMFLGDRSIRIAGMAKGAGMIGPNMATMLCCVLTDARLSTTQADRLLRAAADKSFNNISVESHTSTNDTMLLLANGAACEQELTEAEEAQFAARLESMCIELAKQIPADGEGATHLIEVFVQGTETDAQARKIAVEIARSNLVKCAILGGDPNWGRIVSAAGYAGVPLEPREMSLRINGLELFTAGEPIPFDAAQASQLIRDHFETRIALTVGDGPGKCTHWTSDLSVAYVQFNSEYTT
jgi:glutamate N-acetyltransferase / amino-acid N-acetyltransferase